MAAIEDRHWWYSGMRAIVRALLDQVYAQRRDLRILDAGCGTGGNALALRRYGAVVGVDLAPEALALGRPRLPGALARASVLDLPFAGASFDLVTSFDVLYHRAVTDDRRALAESWRVLRPGGRLLLRLPAYDFLRGQHDRAVHTRRRYTRREARALSESCGFVVERCSYANSLLLALALTKRMLERVTPQLARHRSELILPPPLVNAALRWPLAAEAAWLARGRSFPAGLSVLLLARRDA